LVLIKATNLILNQIKFFLNRKIEKKYFHLTHFFIETSDVQNKVDKYATNVTKIILKAHSSREQRLLHKIMEIEIAKITCGQLVSGSDFCRSGGPNKRRWLAYNWYNLPRQQWRKPSRC
jgi:hypothetical protein